MTNILRDVKSYMEFWGWTNGGGPGSVKLGLLNKILAHHGDAVWIEDVDKATKTIARLADRATGRKGFGGGRGGRNET